jgi:prepilin-type N-terminal cleavage/methylation domain-containing protein
MKRTKFKSQFISVFSVPSVAKKKAFTLIELVVAIGLLSIVLVFSGSIFKASIGSYRTAMAQAEIMRKLRVITEQLNADFKGIQKDAPVAIWFAKDATDIRYDRVAFLAAGDFQSTRQYQYTTGYKTVAGNVASILYMPDVGDPNILVRKQKILTADDTLTLSPVLIDPNEFFKFSIAQWKVWPANNYFADWITFPAINPRLETDIPLYFADGVSNFTVQLAYYDTNSIPYWISANSDFTTWDVNPTVDVSGFVFYFNLYDPDTLAFVSGIEPDRYDRSNQWPLAIKFTFTLYDSKRVFRNGQTFTHIVYLGE